MYLKRKTKKIKPVPVSICVPAYNEGKNIGRLLKSLVHQKTRHVQIHRIIVISSGSTDKTESIVKTMSKDHPTIELIHESHRTGKAAAINLFLNTATDPILVIQSADTIARPRTIEKLCLPMIQDKTIGMTGGAPIPLNDPNTFLGYVIHAWWWFHRNIPRFGEIVAFRNILKKISAKTAVDEAYIQAKIIKRRYKVVHVDDAIVHNKGAETVRDVIKQRRRIFNGHSRLYMEEGVKIDNMTKSSLRLLLFHYKLHSLKELVWLMSGILIEFYARSLGMYDYYVAKINPTIWNVAKTTKDLSIQAEEALS